MKRLVLILASVGAVALAAAPQLAMAQGAQAAAPDPAKIALARQMVELSGGPDQVNAHMKMMFAAVKKGVSEAMPAEQSRLADAIYSDMEQEFYKLTPQLIDISVKTYAQNYTEKEMRDMIAFQMSESGQSISKKSGLVRAQALNETMPLIMSMMPGIMKKTADRACADAHCDAHQREVVAQALSKAFGQPNS